MWNIENGGEFNLYICNAYHKMSTHEIAVFFVYCRIRTGMISEI